jgi:hypothetical protein
MHDMQPIKMAGLCLVAMCALSTIASVTASAAIHWEQCSEGGAATKYSEHQCLKAEGAGKWQWNEVTTTEKFVSNSTLTIKDIKVPIEGTVEVKCSGTDGGTVGPKNIDVTTKITVIGCTAGKGCEEFKKAEARNLPWQTELFETESTVRDKITADGNGAPGWEVECKVLGITKGDECISENETTLVENKATGTELLVLSIFEKSSGKYNCEVGGTGSGEINGSLAILKENVWGLRVS